MGEKIYWPLAIFKAENQHIEYKFEKSSIISNIESLAKSQYNIPRWILTFLFLIVAFLILCLISSIILILIKKPQRVHGESCERSECVSNLGIICLNHICSCPPHQHFTDRCVNLSSFGQPCFDTSQCQSGLICRNSACDCLKTEYWNVSKCQIRMEYKKSCNQIELCRSDLNLICDLNKQVCDCFNLEKYFWNGYKCVEKSSIKDDCSRTSNATECVKNYSLECLNGECNCKESDYWSVENSRCLKKRNEYQECSSDIECMSPMFCSARGHCSCRPFYFHNSTLQECLPKYTFNGSCEFSSQCRQDFGLECSNFKCKCHETTPIWSIDDNRCTLGLDFGKSCLVKTQGCKKYKNLVCVPESGRCECEKIKDNENFWNGSECLKAKSFGEPCQNDIECQTKTQGTYCDHICTCPQPGGFTTKLTCLQCRSGEIFFSDSCYFISTSASKRDDAQSYCALLGGNLAKVESIEHIRFFAASLLNDYYWLSGRRRNATYYWLPSSTSLASNLLCPEFSSGTTDNYDYECLYFDSKPTTECYRPANCNNLYRFVCEIKHVHTL